MKNLLLTVGIYLLQISFLIGGVYFDQKELLNISLWSIWVIIFICGIGLFMDSKKVFIKKNKYKTLPRILAFILLITLIATDYFCTGTFYCLIWLLLYIKRKDYDNELKKDKK